MDPADTQVLFEFLPFVCIYKSGRYKPRRHPRPRPPVPRPGHRRRLQGRDYRPKDRHMGPPLPPNPLRPGPKEEAPPPRLLPRWWLLHWERRLSLLPQLYQLPRSQSRGYSSFGGVPARAGAPLPTAYDDSWLAIRWVASHAEGSGPAEWLNDNADFDRAFLAGESAGGNIAYNVAMRAGEAGLGHGVRVEGLALVHLYFWGTQRLESEHGEVRGRYLNPGILDGQWPAICTGAKDNDDPGVNPVAEGAPSLALLKCARTLVCVAEKDVLRERGKAGVPRGVEGEWGGGGVGPWVPLLQA